MFYSGMAIVMALTVFVGFALLAVAYDVVSRRRVHPVYGWGGLLLAASMPGRLVISGTEAWRAFAGMLVR